MFICVLTPKNPALKIEILRNNKINKKTDNIA